jgi:pyruvate dehydrogenase E2 component (dihydrolipoamide acetyltransferase)/2-oxoisovalerate dehydrogenase E2 component (dihydrolipoyl transacylase)
MDFQVPELGEGLYEAELVEWRVKPGDTVKRGQALMEVMTDKATFEVPSNFAGSITGLNAEPGRTIKVGQVVLSYTPAGKAGDGAPKETMAGRQPSQERQAVGGAARANTGTSRPALAAASVRVAAAPSVRYMARKLGIDLAGVEGTGPGGRVLIDDLTAHVPAVREGEAPAEPGRREPKLDLGKPGTRIKMVGLRRKVAEHMVLAKRSIPHYSYIDECEITDLVRLREQLKGPLARQGVRLTYLPFFVKAAVGALQEVPLVNATLDEDAGEIVLHDKYHIGVAVAVPGGLIVPVIHDADKKDIPTIAREIERLGNEARTGKIKLEDLKRGTFTVTSIGSIGGLISTPVINHPEVGILGLGKTVRRPVYDSAGNIRPADIIYISLSLDHRVVDGAVGAVFANALIKQLQNPAVMLLG